MKKALLMITLVLGCTTVFAQKIDKKEAAQIKSFLSQPAEKDGTNAQALKVTDMNSIASIEGVTVENGHVTAIDWKDKHIAGNLDLSGFSQLKSVNVSRNKIAGLNISNTPVLSEVNASRNALRTFEVNGASAVQKLSINNNRLTDLTLNGRILRISTAPTTTS